MTNKDKTFERIMNKVVPKDITFTELRSFLISRGFDMIPGKGDHVIFRHRGLKQHLSIPAARIVKCAYIKNVQKAILILMSGVTENEQY